MIEKPHLPADLDEERVIVINKTIFDLCLRCIDNIRQNLCEQLHCKDSELKSIIQQNDILKEEVYDLIIDAEKECKKKILQEQKISASHMITCSVIYRSSLPYTNSMEQMDQKRMQKLAELGLMDEKE